MKNPFISRQSRSTLPAPVASVLRFLALLVACLASFGLLQAQSDYSTPYNFTTLAGYAATGSADGVGTAAQFSNPQGMAIDGAGNVYVGDSNNYTIRKITPTGTVTTLAGMPGSAGSADGTGSAARFASLAGLAVDGVGNVYVADNSNNTIRKVTPAGVVTTLAGTAGVQGFADGTGSAAQFNEPLGVAVDGTGNVYVADRFNCTIRKITLAGVVTTFAGKAGEQGSADGTGTAARFTTPLDVAVDGAGNIYVADTGNCEIRKITPAGVVTTLAGSPGNFTEADGTGSTAGVVLPSGVTVDGSGNVYVTENVYNTIRKITATGVVTTLAGTVYNPGSADGTGSAATFGNPWGIATDGAGDVYVADEGNSRIRKITPVGVVTTIAGITSSAGSTNGPGSVARFNNPIGLATDGSGNIYVADFGNQTIRKVTPAGVTTTFAGTPGQTGYADGTGSAALFSQPEGLAVDQSGNVYVSDHSSMVRKITPAGAVTTLAGSLNNRGSGDGIGSAAQFSFPMGLAVDGAGNVYVADSSNYTIRKIAPNGTVSTLAGLAGSWGSTDGMGSAARFGSSQGGPTGVAVDAAGNVYVVDSNNSTIRKITADGTVSTIAGAAGSSGSTDGVGSAARFLFPFGITLDDAGNAYVTDRYNSTIRKITPTGVVTTLAGSARGFSSADGTGSIARFSSPAGITVDATGTIYVADSGNNTIRKGTAAAPGITTQPISQTVGAGYSASFTAAASGTPVPSYQWQRLPAGSGTRANLSDGGSYSGTTTGTLTVSSATLGMNGDQFRCIATNSVGSVTSSAATLTVLAMTPPSNAVITITVQ